MLGVLETGLGGLRGCLGGWCEGIVINQVTNESRDTIYHIVATFFFIEEGCVLRKWIGFILLYGLLEPRAGISQRVCTQYCHRPWRSSCSTIDEHESTTLS